jgi:hypothetical protein
MNTALSATRKNCGRLCSPGHEHIEANDPSIVDMWRTMYTRVLACLQTLSLSPKINDLLMIANDPTPETTQYFLYNAALTRELWHAL